MFNQNQYFKQNSQIFSQNLLLRGCRLVICLIQYLYVVGIVSYSSEDSELWALPDEPEYSACCIDMFTGYILAIGINKVSLYEYPVGRIARAAPTPLPMFCHCCCWCCWWSLWNALRHSEHFALFQECIRTWDENRRELERLSRRDSLKDLLSCPKESKSIFDVEADLRNRFWFLW